MFKKRIKYPKGTAENYMYKIALNGTFGKSNTKHDQWLKDPKYLADTTINGQLLLAMLAEDLSSIGELLMINTDGLEVFMPSSKLKKYNKICQDWMDLTELALEFDNYDTLHITDVNNYHGIYDTGKVKRKGSYMIYYDYTEEDGKPHSYHKNPSACIIPLALNEHFTKGTPVEDTINNCNNIFEFCYGIKKQRNFEHAVISCEDGIITNIDKFKERAMRYYVSTSGGNLMKLWNDGRANNVTRIHQGHMVKPAMIIPKDGIITEEVRVADPNSDTGAKIKVMQNRYQDLDLQYYINEANKILNSYGEDENTL